MRPYVIRASATCTSIQQRRSRAAFVLKEKKKTKRLAALVLGSFSTLHASPVFTSGSLLYQSACTISPFCLFGDKKKKKELQSYMVAQLLR